LQKVRGYKTINPLKKVDIIAIKETRRHRLFFEIKGIIAIVLSIFLAISIFSYDRWDKSFFVYSNYSINNYGGIVGSFVADLFHSFIGISSYVVPLILLIYGIRRVAGLGRNWFYRIGAFLLIISLSFIAELLSRTPFFNILISGGLFGYLISETSLSLISKMGSYILAIGIFLISLLLLSPVSPILFLRDLKKNQPVKAEDKIVKDGLPVNNQEEPLSDNKIETQAATIKDTDEKDDLVPIQIQDFKFTIESKEELYQIPNKELIDTRTTGQYQLPPLDLLNNSEETETPSRQDIQSAVSGLEKKLSDFGVSGKIRQANPGPVVTMFEYEPAPGIKINKIVSLADDLALALRAQSVRVYPISGKAAIGIEVPNKVRATLSLKEIISSDSFQKSLSLLTLALGKDISGMPVVTDLSRMPHLLVAGTTGSGKSVFMNTMILSLLYKARPDQIKMLMIDPKLLELSLYGDIPHLISPVITSPKDASEALKKIVYEMEKRYKILSEKGARSIDTFNRVCEPDERLPYIVVFIDELADLMFTAPKEVENSITRLAQMARAAGIHLILATQRPSVDVITGLIKANFPARISFQVTTKIDSRTILDSQGAEQLLGKGDMLFMLPGIKIIRVHGAYVSESEVKAVTEFIKAQASPDYTKFEQMAIQAIEDKEQQNLEQGDDYYRKAKEYAESVGEISISGIQRRLKIGYNKAASIMEAFEREGLVGPPKGAGKPRDYLGNRQ